MAGAQVTGSTFVARSRDAWLLAPTPGGPLEPVTLDALCDRIGLTGESPTVEGHDRLADADLVLPTWLWVGAVTPGEGLAIEPLDGGRLVLDGADLAILDIVSTERTVGWLKSVLHRGDVAARLARLADAGKLEVRRAEQPAASPSPGPRSRWFRRRPSPEPHVPPVASPADSPAPAADATEHPPPVRPVGGPHPGGPSGRIPVYAVWHKEVGPLLALGMLTAAARAHDGGALQRTFEIRRPETAESFLADLADRSGPAVLLCSDYVWSIEQNLAAAHAGLAINPELVVVHGGPSSPRYEGDARRFLDDHRLVAHVLARGEGEGVLCDVLDSLADSLPRLDPRSLAAIDGITFRDPDTGEVVRTRDRARLTDLDALPSPYLTGEFDHIDPRDWNTCLSVETSRGCPYSCTFCDWGSATNARIRLFGLERVNAEIRWAAERGVTSLNLADANFGIMSRDVETSRHIARIKRETGHPTVVSFYPAKNTTKHLAHIMDIMLAEKIGTTASISLQTSDVDTLAAIERSNISTDHYVALAADYRRRGIPLQGDLLLGLPGQTYDSYRRDLQFNLDHEILSRTWQVHILPNAPMNDPAYRERFAVEYDDDHRVTATSTFTAADRERMLRLRRVDIVFERLGLLRHVLRWLQWDHDIAATAVMDRVLDLCAEGHLPHTAWILDTFDRIPAAPGGWSAFYDEVRGLLADEYGIARSSALDTVLALNRFLMPAPLRPFPASIPLAHDYVAYYRDATDSLYTTGHAGRPPRSLDAYGPTTFTIVGDPLGLCVTGIKFSDKGTEEMEGDFTIGANTAYELESPLLRLLPHLSTIDARLHDDRVAGHPDEDATDPVDDDAERPPEPPASVGAVTMRPRSPRPLLAP